MKKIRLMIVAALAGAMVVDANAQKLSQQQRRERMDSVLTARYYKTPYDTNFVVRPEGRLTLKVILNQSGDDFHVKGEQDGISSKADLSTSRKTTVSIAASYRGLSAALAINPAKLRGAYEDYEFYLSYYSSRISVDASYHRATTLAGDVRRGDMTEHLESGDVKLKVANLAGYYVFNHRQFSFPAAFTQSYIQRRSAGSWLAGISYQGGSIESREEMKKRAPDAPHIKIKANHLGIGGGYGYNWVLGNKWLFHFSMLPTIVIYNRNYMIVDDMRREEGKMRFNMIFNERAAIVHNFSSRYFAGATLVMSNSVFSDDALVANQNKWRARAFFGIRI
jgi:hypothetical protein